MTIRAGLRPTMWSHGSDALLARGLTSVRDGHLAAIKTLFNYGVRNRLLKRNAAEGLTTARKTQAGRRRLPYDDDEVARLLSTKHDHPVVGCPGSPRSAALASVRSHNYGAIALSRLTASPS